MFSGSLTALITPFENGSIDTASLKKLVRHQIDNGSQGIVALGTTGETPVLSVAEYQSVLDIVVQEVAGEIPVIAGCGSNHTAHALETAEKAARCGATAALHVTGYYNRPNQEGLYQHFASIAQASRLPILVYNVPSRTIVDIEPQTMARIAELPGVVGVKDATNDLSRPLRERLLIGPDFCLLSGEDQTALAYNANGGQGAISVTANIAPALCAQMQAACLNGNFAQALTIQRRLMPLHRALFVEPSPAGAKYAASLLELCQPDCRLPMVELRGSTKQTIRTAMEEIELL